jgi:DNA primase
MFVNLGSNNPKHDKRFICHRCGIQGNHKAFLVVYYGYPYHEILENFGHLLSKEENPFISTKQQAQDLAKNSLTISIDDDSYEECIIDLPKEFQRLRVTTNFCNRRNIPFSIIKHFKVGRCDSGFYEGRLIIPIKTNHNQSFFAYSQSTKKALKIFKELSKKNKQNKMLQKAKKKVLYPAGTMMSTLLFNYNHIKKHSKIIFVHEGFTDCVRTILFGFHPVAIGSNRISNAQARLLSDKESEEICLMLDSDVDDKTLTSNLKTLANECDSRISFIRLLSGDPDDIPERKNFIEIIAHRKVYPVQTTFNFNKGGLLF